MTEHCQNRLTRVPRRILALGIALVAAIAFASPAMAVPHGEFAPFAQCPVETPEMPQCILAMTTSGEFKVGNTTVPISKTITLQGGLNEEARLVAAKNGETLSKTSLTVPGGLLGIVAPTVLPLFLQEIFNNFINEGLTGVTATTELAGPASSVHANEIALLLESGTALELPVKVKLGNAFLGGNCYIGSNSHPILLKLTTGATSPPPPNTSIHGSRGTPVSNGLGTLLTFTGNSLVDNSYAAPGVSGCGGIFSFLVDPAVDLKIGLPSAAGKNTAILNGTLQVAASEAVRASE
jgi:hypothetical protein